MQGGMSMQLVMELVTMNVLMTLMLLEIWGMLMLADPVENRLVCVRRIMVAAEGCPCRLCERRLIRGSQITKSSALDTFVHVCLTNAPGNGGHLRRR